MDGRRSSEMRRKWRRSKVRRVVGGRNASIEVATGRRERSERRLRRSLDGCRRDAGRGNGQKEAGERTKGGRRRDEDEEGGQQQHRSCIEQNASLTGVINAP